MFVHTCCYILFCIGWFETKHQNDSNGFENGFAKTFEIKEKGICFSLPLAFGPLGLFPPVWPSSTLQFRVAQFSFSRALALGPAQQQADARTPPSSLSPLSLPSRPVPRATDNPGPNVRGVFFPASSRNWTLLGPESASAVTSPIGMLPMPLPS